jgi:hypothetical protein
VACSALAFAIRYPLAYYFFGEIVVWVQPCSVVKIFLLLCVSYAIFVLLSSWIADLYIYLLMGWNRNYFK